MKSRTVILLTNNITGGGAEKQMLFISSALQARGWKCAIFWLNERSLTHQSMHLGRALGNGVELAPPQAGWSPGLMQLLTILMLLHKSRDAVLWTWGYRADILAIVLRTFGCSNPIVGSLRSAYRQRIQAYRWFWKVVGQTHDAFVSNTHANIDMVGEVASAVEAKSTVICNAVEEAFFAAPSRLPMRPPSSLRIVMLGNQSMFTKGYDLALEVAARLVAGNVPARIFVGGEPRDAAVMQREIAGRRLPVELVGHVGDPIEFLGSGHLFLMLSRYEGLPNALLEAMALGLPAICTRVGDVPRFAQDNVHLRLIDTSAEAAFAAVCERFNDWPGTVRMANAGRDLCASAFGGAAIAARAGNFVDSLAWRNGGGVI